MSTLQPPPVPHLYLLAFDDRQSLEHSLLGLSGPPTPDETDTLRELKTLIYTGFRLALRDGVEDEEVGVLVDAHYGADVARHALEQGTLLALSVENHDRNEPDFEYGEAFGANIETFDPAFTLVRVHYNPEGDRAMNRRQQERLAHLTDWLETHGRRFLLELRVPPTRKQLGAVDGSLDRYDHELRPLLLVRAMGELQAGGVKPDIWSMEGLDQPADCLRVARQARNGDRAHVSCIVLDADASWERVEHRLRVAASTPGFIGFALGHTLWWEPLQALHERRLTASEAARRISINYQRALITWDKAALSALPQGLTEAAPS